MASGKQDLGVDGVMKSSVNDILHNQACGIQSKEATSSQAVALLVDHQLAELLENRLKPRFENDVYRALYTDLVEYVARPGKRIRPLLYLYGRQIFEPGHNLFAKEDLSIAAGIELMHAFVLVHDDIIDRSDFRRGLPSLHKMVEKRLSQLSDRERESQNIAIVLGDILFAMAQGAILSSGVENCCDVANRFVDYVIDTGLGETADIIHGSRDLSKVSLRDIEHMYLLKTTRYTIECPLVLAAVAGGASEDLLDGIAYVSEPAGLAFQIENDLKAYERFELSDAEVPDDLLDGKKTAVVRTAFDRLQNGDRSLLQICMSGERHTDATITKIKELIYKSEALPVMRAKVDELFEEAERRTRELPCDPSTSSGLQSLIHQLRHLTNGK